MTRTPLVRRTPIRRRKRLRSLPARRLRRPGSNPRYLATVRGLPCCLDVGDHCSGRIDPHHAGRRPGIGMKAPDNTAIPLCRNHHQQIETLTGFFAGWRKEQVRAWEDERIAETQAWIGRLEEAA